MLKTVSLEALTQALMREHPGWSPIGAKKQAQEYIDFFDERMDKPIHDYLETGKPAYFSYGKYSLSGIQALCKCTFLEAAEIMDAYLKDEAVGTALIFRG